MLSAIVWTSLTFQSADFANRENDMEPENLFPPKTVAHDIKYHAQPLALALKVTDAVDPECVRLVDSTGKLSISIPRAVLPFAEPNGMMIVSMCFMKAEVKSQLIGVQ